MTGIGEPSELVVAGLAAQRHNPVALANSMYDRTVYWRSIDCVVYALSEHMLPEVVGICFATAAEHNFGHAQEW